MPKTRRPQPTRIRHRRNLLESLEAIFENAALRAAAEGRQAAADWPAAVVRDTASVRFLADTFVRDLNLFLKSRRRFVRLHREFRPTFTWDHPEADRPAALWPQFRDQARAYVNGLVKNLTAKGSYFSSSTGVMTDMPFPACWILKEGPCVHFLWADDPATVTARRLIRAAYVDPQDFPRHLPPLVKELLTVASLTELDYNPAVLDGVLVEENQLTLVRPQDPGLVLRTGHDILIHYWSEPEDAAAKQALARNPWSAWEEVGAPLACTALAALVFALLGWFLGPGTGWRPVANVLACGCWLLAAFALVAGGVGLAQLFGRKHRTLSV